MCASCYGISGLSVKDQLDFWRAVAYQLKAIGLPIILMGDWQTTPSEMESTGFPRMLDAVVCAPRTFTNTTSRRTIDYFIVSNSLAEFVLDVEVSVDTRFSPHLPVVLRMAGGRSTGRTSRVAQPRILPVSKPVGPMPAGLEIQWDGWMDSDADDDDEAHSSTEQSRIDEAANQWYAGAEAELLSTFGKAGTQEEALFAGIGMPIRMVQGSAAARRHEASDAMGLLGHRLGWAARNVHLAIRWGTALTMSEMEEERGTDNNSGGRGSNPQRVLGERPPMQANTRSPGRVSDLDDVQRRRIAWLLRGIGSRAIALRRECGRLKQDESDAEQWRTLSHALGCLGHLVRSHHRKGPIIFDWMQRRTSTAVADFAHIETELARVTADLSERRHKRDQKAVRTWAMNAPLRTSHAATKINEVRARYTASSSKDHLGEINAQTAADRGVDEWSNQWHADEEDEGDAILTLVKAQCEKGPTEWAQLEEGTMAEIALPPSRADASGGRRLPLKEIRGSALTSCGHATCPC